MRISDWSSDVCSSDLDAGLAALDDSGRDGRPVDVGKRLGSEDDRRVLLAQRLQPLTELAGEALDVEREPALVDDAECGAAVEAIFDPVAEIGEHGGCGTIRSAGRRERGGQDGESWGVAV